MTYNMHPVEPRSRGTLDAEKIMKFLRSCAEHNLNLNSILIHQSGNLLVEHYSWPYRRNIPHSLHSAAKSFVGTAVGFAQAESKLQLSDRVVDFYPELVPAGASQDLTTMTIQDLLTMRTGHNEGLSGATWRLLETSWVAEFMSSPVVHKPGQEFIYSSGSSHMLSAIVQRATGKSVFDYLTPRLFDPLDFENHSWDTDPEGITTGGNGLTLRSLDFLKWGQLHLQDGMWDGNQILPLGWCADMSKPRVTRVVPNTFDDGRYLRSNGDTLAPHFREGYGYQVWCGPHGSYYASGMFGQKCLVLPELDAVVAITASISPKDHPLFMPLIEELLIPALIGPASSQSARWKLDGVLAESARSPSPPVNHRDTPIPGNVYECEPNEDGVAQIAVAQRGNQLEIVVTDDRGSHTILADLGKWISTSTSLTGWRLHHSYQDDISQVVTGAYWASENQLALELYFVQTPFHDSVTLTFGTDGDLFWDRSVNVNSGRTRADTIRAHTLAVTASIEGDTKRA